MRLTWVQPEDLLPHAIVQARSEGVDVSVVQQQWVAAGGAARPAVGGASEDAGQARLRPLARELLARLDAATPGYDGDRLEELQRSWTAAPALSREVDPQRQHGAWLGRAAGCLLGKPVEKIPRDGIREIAQATGNWPVSGYFTEVGLPADVAARWPWNRRSRPTSLVENIDGMPEDDDLNFAMLALGLFETAGRPDTEDVAQAWLDGLPAGRVFTAERIAYRNLLEGVDPNSAGTVRNPFREWIGALIRADVHGWVHAGDPHAAARSVHPDAWLSHRRDGLYGALFAAALAAAALVAEDVQVVLDAGLSVVPGSSGLAGAVRFGRDLAATGSSLDDALDALHREYGHLHWVHVVNNTALLAYALAAGNGDFVRTTGIAVMGGWDTDSVGATAGAICGALGGAAAVPERFAAPLHDRIASSLPGFDGSSLAALAARTNEVRRRLATVAA